MGIFNRKFKGSKYFLLPQAFFEGGIVGISPHFSYDLHTPSDCGDCMRQCRSLMLSKNSSLYHHFAVELKSGERRLIQIKQNALQRWDRVFSPWIFIMVETFVNLISYVYSEQPRLSWTRNETKALDDSILKCIYGRGIGTIDFFCLFQNTAAI